MRIELFATYPVSDGNSLQRAPFGGNKGLPVKSSALVNNRRHTMAGYFLPKAGDIFYSSWGYSMTLVDYIKIVEVSKSGKTVVCMRIGSTSDGNTHGPGGGRSMPNPKVELTGHGKFRLYVRHYKGDTSVYLRGKYPFAGPDSRRMGTFWKTDKNVSHYTNYWD